MQTQIELIRCKTPVTKVSGLGSSCEEATFASPVRKPLVQSLRPNNRQSQQTPEDPTPQNLDPPQDLSNGA